MDKQAINQLIEKWEGLRLKAYKCPAGIWTIGIGSTKKSDGTPVKEGDTCTAEQAFEYLQNHLQHQVYPFVDKLLSHCDSYPDGVYTALCSFGYNLGCGHFKEQSFIDAVTNQDWQSLANTILKFCKARVNGELVEIKGLKARRQDEVAQFI